MPMLTYKQLPAKFLIKSDAEYKLRIATEQGIIEVPANMLNTADISKLVKNDFRC